MGRLYPVLVDKHGRVIDGEHRLRAYPDWFKVKLPDVESEEHRILVRLVSNMCRRVVSPSEKTEILEELGQVYLEQGVPRSELIKKIVQQTGMSYRWVMKYAPNDLKMKPGIGGPRSQKRDSERNVAWRATEDALLSEPTQRVANLLSYSNTDFATILLEKQFYSKLKQVASELAVDVGTIINNALLLTFQKMKELAKQNERSQLICMAK